MALDFTTVLNKLTAKQGYDSSFAKSNSLDDLRKLMINMNGKRNGSGSTTSCSSYCNGNTAFDDSNVADSIGDYDVAAGKIKGLTCACNGKVEACTDKGWGCGCYSQGYTPGDCTCNITYECNAYGPPYYCENVTGYGGEYCYCHVEGPGSGCGTDEYCTGQTSGKGCSCNNYYNS